MSSPTAHEQDAASNSASPARDSLWRSLLIGLLPLILLVGISLITFAVVAYVRQLLTPAGFLEQQRIDLIILISGLVLAISAYSMSIWRILRRLTIWQAAGLERHVRIVMWTLLGTALIALLPIIVAVLLPQHPAP